MAILFLISLFFFRSGSRTSNLLNSDSVIAKISNTSVTTNKFVRTMEMNIKKFNEMLGKELSGDEIRAFQIHTLALGALINNAVFEDEYDKINFKIDEKVIALKTKERIPQLYDSNNKLNQIYLSSFLQQQQLKVEDIVQIINFETRNEYFDNAFFDINFPKYFSNQINIFNKQKRTLKYIEIDIEKVSIEDKTKNSDINVEIKKYYNDNINNYMSKEIRSVEYIVIDKKLLQEKFIPSDLEISEYYNANKKLFFQNEKRSFTQFNFKTLDNAKSFKEKIQKLNLAEILEISKQNNYNFIDFEDLEELETLKEISTPLFNLNLNEQSDIIETPLSKIILILNSIKSPRQIELKNVKDEIIDTISNIDSENYFNELSNEISEKILNGQDIQSIAKKYNFNIEFIKNLTKGFKNSDSDKEIVIPNLIKSSFGSNKDFVSDIIKVDKNISYIFNVKEIILPEPLRFDEIKDIAKKDWEKFTKIKKIEIETEKNRNNLEFINDLALSFNLEINNKNLEKNSNDFPKNITSLIFDSEKNINLNFFYNEKFIILNIEEIIMDKKISSTELISIKENLRSAFGSELMKNKKIKTNDNVITSIIDQY